MVGSVSCVWSHVKRSADGAGRAVLQSVVGDRPQVQALLRSVPAGIPNGTFATFILPGQPSDQTHRVELGDFTGSSLFVFDDHQGSLRLDHRFNEKNLFYVRYRFDSQDSSGGGQVTPPGLTTVNESRSSALAIVLNTVLTSRSSNDARLACYNSVREAMLSFRYQRRSLQ